MPEIIIHDLANVSIDGVSAGTIPDVLTNYGSVEGIRGAVQLALEDWYAIRKQANAAALQAAADAHAAERAQDAADHQTALTAALMTQADEAAKTAEVVKQRHDSQVSELNARIADLAAQLAKVRAESDEHDANAVTLVAKGGESKSFSGWAFTSEGIVDLTGQGRTFSADGDDHAGTVSP